MLRKNEYKDMQKFKKTKREQQKRYYQKTQNAQNNNKPWSDTEIEMIMAKEVSDRELSKLLGRSMRAILAKRYKKITSLSIKKIAFVDARKCYITERRTV